MDKSVLYSASFREDIVCNKGDVALVPGVFNKIGEYIVKADEFVGIGRGGYSALNDAVGRLFAKFKDTTGADILTGRLRIMLVSSQDMPIGAKPVHLDVDLAQLTVGENTPSERYVLPFEGTMLQRDRKIQFFVYNPSATSVTLDASVSKVLMDMTRALV